MLSDHPWHQGQCLARVLGGTWKIYSDGQTVKSLVCRSVCLLFRGHPQYFCLDDHKVTDTDGCYKYIYDCRSPSHRKTDATMKSCTTKFHLKNFKLHLHL